MNSYLFVGERPSPKAAAIGATWHNGRLSAKNLREAIVAAGLEPSEQRYLNLWADPERGHPSDAGELSKALLIIRGLVTDGWSIVGMGALVCRALRRAGIAHRQLVHPAARGSIRLTENYRAHVRETLAGGAL